MKSILDKKEIVRMIVVLRQLQRHNEDMLGMVERSIGMNKVALAQLKKILNEPLYHKDN